MRFYVSRHFQSLKAIENGGASVRRGNSELIRISLNDAVTIRQARRFADNPLEGSETWLYRSEHSI